MVSGAQEWRAVRGRPVSRGESLRRWLTKSWWVVACPVLALLIGAVAVVSGADATLLPAEVLAATQTRTRAVVATVPTIAPVKVGSGDQSAVTPAQVGGAPQAVSPVDAAPMPPPSPAPSSTVAPPSTQAEPSRPVATTSEPPRRGAPPTTLRPVEAAQRDDVATRTLSRISYPWESRLPDWRIEFVGPRSGYRGSTFPDEKLIQIYVRPNASDDELAHVAAHEIGHAVDVTYLDEATRAAFNMNRGRAADATWWVASGADDFSSGAGDWAECFAWAQLRTGPWYSRLGPRPGADTIALVDALASR